MKSTRPTSTNAQVESDRFHTDYYQKHDLFQQGTWLEKPNSKVMELGALLSRRERVSALDLGAGVGRNAIPFAKLFAQGAVTIDCVDIIEVAVEKLRANAAAQGVSGAINPILSNVADFHIRPDSYDAIMAMSVLEHAFSADLFESGISRLQAGTKREGFNCLSITTDLKERDCRTGEDLVPLIATPISSKECREVLQRRYKDWEITHLSFSPFSETVERDDRTIEWSANYCLVVARR
jgi:SAM-dependent methyltransferase